jgi:hypothetical protein
VSRDFCFWFFSCISFPPDPEYSIKTVSNFFENSQRYSRVKEHHRYQRHRWQICHRYQRHRWQIFPPFSLALLIHMLTLLPKGVQTKLLKFFCLKVFSICYRCPETRSKKSRDTVPLIDYACCKEQGLTKKCLEISQKFSLKPHKTADLNQ